MRCKRTGCYSDAVCKDGHCAHHTRAVESRLADYSNRTYPRSDKPHLGVEIECYAPSQLVWRAMRAQTLQGHQDGSLPDMGCEYKLCGPVATQLKRVPAFVRRLTTVGAEVNNKCGLHVHLDARNVYYHRTKGFLNWLCDHQDMFFEAMPPSRRDNAYVRRLPYLGHYAWAGRTDYNTVEIRIHGGTLNSHKMLGWLSVCADLMDWLRCDQPFPTLDCLGSARYWIDTVFSRKAGNEYFKARLDNNGVLPDYSTSSTNGQRAESEVA